MRRWLLLTLGIAGFVLLSVVSWLGVRLIAGETIALAAEAPTQGPAPSGPAHGQPGHGWLGVQLVQLNAEIAQRLGLSRSEGVAVVAVVAGSPAEAAGFRNRDVILRVGETQVSTVRDVVQAVRGASPGTQLTFVVERGGQQVTLTVTVGTLPEVHRKDRVPGPRGFGIVPRVLPELEGVERGSLFDHFRGGQLELLDRNQQPFTVRIIPGTVAAVSDSSITIAPTGGGAQVTLRLTERTRPEPARLSTALQAGQRVMVFAIGDEARIVVGMFKR